MRAERRREIERQMMEEKKAGAGARRSAGKARAAGSAGKSRSAGSAGKGKTGFSRFVAFIYIIAAAAFFYFIFKFFLCGK